MENYEIEMQLRDARRRAGELEITRVTMSHLVNLAIPNVAERIPKVQFELGLILEVKDDCSTRQIIDATRLYDAYLMLLQGIGILRDDQFITQRREILAELTAKWDDTRDIWPAFAAAALTRNGLLANKDNISEQILQLTRESENSVRAVGAEMINKANLLLDQAQSEASRIESKAHETAKKISIKEAQDQFNEASKSLFYKGLVCILFGACSFSAFIRLAYVFYKHVPTASREVPQLYEVIYVTALRITILTAIGALTTFFLKMLRAYLHMSEVNNHRRRVANSMAAFVESADSSEQRDIILGRLIDSIVTFGDSGILNKDVEGISVPSVVIDAVTKNLSTKA